MIAASAAGEAFQWPDGTQRLAFEDLDGVILIEATLSDSAGRDTTGSFVLDTGAGFLVLDGGLAERMGLAREASPNGSIGVADLPLARIRLGELAIHQVQPVLTFDAEIVRRVTDRPVLGLLGQAPIRDRALWVDFERESLALVPAGPASASDTPAESLIATSRRITRGLVSAGASAFSFRLAEDGKVLLRARITPRTGAPSGWLTFVLDTGASKCVLFETRRTRARASGWRPAAEGLIAPTLVGRSSARMIRAARVEVSKARDSNDSRESGLAQRARRVLSALRLAPAEAHDVDLVILDSQLGADLERSIGEPVDGLLGYSFLRQFRVVCDYPHRVLWLDPIPGYRDERPLEHSHAGLQLEREGGAARVVAVVERSPAARAGIRAGDEVVAIDGTTVLGMSVLEVSRRMEGAPGTTLTLALRRGDHETTYRLRRQRLL